MKLKLFLSLLVISQITYAQSKLTVESSKLQWQAIYSDNTHKNLKDAFLTNVSFEQITVIDENTLVGQFLIKPNWRETFRISNVPIFVRDNDISGNAKVQFKDGRYRITVNNLETNWTGSTQLWPTGKQDPLEVYLLKKDGSVRPKYVRDSSVIKLYENELYKHFDIPDAEDDNW